MILGAAALIAFSVAGVAQAQDEAQTIQCDTGSGFYRWHIPEYAETITETVSGLRLEILNVTNDRFIAQSDPSSQEIYILLELWYSEGPDYEVTFHRQRAETTRGWGSSVRHNVFEGACHRVD